MPGYNFCVSVFWCFDAHHRISLTYVTWPQAFSLELDENHFVVHQQLHLL